MGKSTHPFVQRMNEHKAVHKAMRAGEEQETETEAATETPKAEAKEAKGGKRSVPLKRKGQPVKAILSAVIAK